MRSEYTLKISILDPGRAPELVEVDGVRAWLGSASHCDVRLAPDRVAPEQLLFEVHNGQLFATACSSRPAVLLHQMPFHRGRLLPDAVLTVEQLELRVSLEQNLLAEGMQGEGRVRPALLAVGLVVLTLLVLAAIQLGRRPHAPPVPEAPRLFTENVEHVCPESDGAAARLAGSELARAADTKRERAFFVPEEGLLAVPLYLRAMHCFEIAADGIQARAQRQKADALRALVERDYQLHQVRVYLAERAHDVDTLTREAKVLHGYLRDRPGEYRDWLGQLQREIDASQANRKGRSKGRS